MPYVDDKVDDLEGTEKVGSKQCVALLPHCASVSRTTIFLRKKGARWWPRHSPQHQRCAGLPLKAGGLH